MENNTPEKHGDLPTSDILIRIKNNLIDPALLDKSTRQACVEVLMVEGYTQSSIASLFKVHDRTIRRDWVEIRQRNAVSASPELTKQLVGELIMTERNHYASLKQIARIKDAYPDEKTRAEAMAWKVRKELIEKLFLIGYITNTDGLAVNKPSGIKSSTANPPQGDRSVMQHIQELDPMDRERLAEKWRKDLRDMHAKNANRTKGGAKKDDQPPPVPVSPA